MEIVFHIGVHRSGSRELVRSLLNHRDILQAQQIAVPGPSRYKELIGQAANTLRGQLGDADTRETILGASLDIDDAERIIFSNESFICLPLKALEERRFYARAFKSEWLRNLFHYDEVEFAISLKNPVSFLSEMYSVYASNGLNWEDTFTTQSLHAMRWSHFVQDVRRYNPETQITVWCQEDTPLTWAEVIKEVSGHDPYTDLDVDNDILATIMHREGMRKMRAQFEASPPQSEAERRHIVAEYLDQYVVPGRVEETIEIPGWTDRDTEIATEAYEEDIDAIADMPGVYVITS